MFNGFTESEAVVKVRWEAMQKRAAMILKYEMEAALTQAVLAKVRANRLAREASLETRASVAEALESVS